MGVSKAATQRQASTGATDMPAFPSGYKRTEVGVIPGDWEVKKLGEIARVATGNTPPTRDASNYGDDFLFVSPADLGNSKYIIHTEKRLSRKGFDISRKFPANSILFTCIGSTIGKSGIAAIELTSNQQINAIFPDDSFSSDFLFYSLDLLASCIKSMAGEQAVPIINKTEFENTLIPFPPTKPEQTAIATMLSDVDELIEALDRLIAKKRAVKTAAMQQLLTSKTRLPGFSGKWQAKLMGDIGTTYGGLTGKTKADFGKGSAKYIPFLNVIENVTIDPKNLEQVHVNRTEAQNHVRKGDLFFNGSSETPEEVGMCSVLLHEFEEVYLNSFCFGFRLYENEQPDGLYLAYFFRSGEGRSLLYLLAQGATRYNLSKTNFLKLQVPLPDPEEQRAIATVLSDMDAEIAALERRREKIRALKRGMMQELLTGRIRLVKPENAQEVEA